MSLSSIQAPAFLLRAQRPRRILYGVQGEGRGHAARSLEVIGALIKQGHSVMLFTGGDALPILHGLSVELREVPLLRYFYHRCGRMSPWLTFKENFPLAFGCLTGLGKKFNSLQSMAKRFRPDLVICDFEPYVAKIAYQMRIPHIALNHQHFLLETKIPSLKSIPKNLALILNQVMTYLLSGKPDRIITSSFFHFPPKPNSRALFVGPLLSPLLRAFRGKRGKHVTVYLKNAKMLPVFLRVAGLLSHQKFELFTSSSLDDLHIPRNVHTHAIDRKRFLESLASSKALLATAGNQMVGEAFYLRKPVLVIPEPGVLEQELNALALEHSQCGEWFYLQNLNVNVLRNFLKNLAKYRRGIRKCLPNPETYDGSEAILQEINKFLVTKIGETKESVVPGHASSRSPNLVKHLQPVHVRQKWSNAYGHP